MNPKSVLLPVLLVAAFGSAPTRQAFTRSYGMSCSEDHKCNSRTGTIACNVDEQKCRCSNHDSMVYDEREDRCYSIEGGVCTLHESSDGDSISCLEGLTCVEVPSKVLMGKCVSTDDSSETEERDGGTAPPARPGTILTDKPGNGTPLTEPGAENTDGDGAKTNPATPGTVTTPTPQL